MYQISSGTRLPAKHLQKEHDIPDQSERQVRNKRQQSSIENAMKLGDQLPQKRRRLEENSRDSICGDHLEVLFVKFITSCNYHYESSNALLFEISSTILIEISTHGYQSRTIQLSNGYNMTQISRSRGSSTCVQ